MVTTNPPAGSIYNKRMTGCPDKPQRRMVGADISCRETCAASVFSCDKEGGSTGVWTQVFTKTPRANLQTALELGGVSSWAAAGACKGSRGCTGSLLELASPPPLILHLYHFH